MKRLLTDLEIERILLGSSWFGTGGGLTLAEQRAQAARLTGPVHLVTPADLDPAALVCCAYGVGPAGSGTAGIIEAFQRAMEILPGVTGGAPIAAIFPAEANIAGAVFELAGELNLPVLDGDTTGGRAVPEIRIDNFVLHGRTVTPLVAVSSRGEEIIIVEPRTSRVVEIIERDGSARSARGGGSGPRELQLSSAEQRIVYEAVIRDFDPVDVRVKLGLGASIPRSVELDRFPRRVLVELPQLKDYRFVVVEREVVIVDPRSREIVLVIDA